ncbi:MAG: tetratricopeptide repeat protein [Treponema sp.]|nr:tetratricopeptide repeat protein [Treponema sp.]
MRRFSGIIIYILLAIFYIEAQSPGGTGQTLSALQNYQRGRDLESQNRTSESNALYNEAVRICLDEISRNAATRTTYTVIAWTMQRQRRYADVISWGERGLRIYPDEHRIVEIMGEAYFYLGNYERSLTYMQRYTNALPQGDRASIAFFFIGEIYRLTQKYHHADIAYTTALRIEPNIALWWYRLASVREQINDRNPAIEAYQQALRYNPNYREARDGLTRLQ